MAAALNARAFPAKPCNEYLADPPGRYAGMQGSARLETQWILAAAHRTVNSKRDGVPRLQADAGPTIRVSVNFQTLCASRELRGYVFR
ncbi:hypothetical protein [Burkholderia cepacia]|uniref:hypothetical protein n=1 Tax=Burkholderia cepacia TaxID=292 RepID=UPI00158B7615|nr:hypothetical protein [Burkholderia cepacia]